MTKSPRNPIAAFKGDLAVRMRPEIVFKGKTWGVLRTKEQQEEIGTLIEQELDRKIEFRGYAVDCP